MEMKNYNISVFGAQWIYEEILPKGYKVLVYSGNSDMIVPTVGTQRWI
jgi:Serine carboxypeptidase